MNRRIFYRNTFDFWHSLSLRTAPRNSKIDSSLDWHIKAQRIATQPNPTQPNPNLNIKRKKKQEKSKRKIMFVTQFNLIEVR